MIDSSLVRLAAAYHFSAVRHLQQRRKGHAAEPYMNHLTEVAELIAVATAGDDLELIMAGVLHDTVEDTVTQPEELAERFGVRVAALVAEVTDDKSLPKQRRKALQVEHAAHASPGAKIIKLADKTSNLRALAASPPKDWGYARKREYLDWARQVAQGCRLANAWLAEAFDAAAAALEATLSD